MAGSEIVERVEVGAKTIDWQRGCVMWRVKTGSGEMGMGRKLRRTGSVVVVGRVERSGSG